MTLAYDVTVYQLVSQFKMCNLWIPVCKTVWRKYTDIFGCDDVFFFFFLFVFVLPVYSLLTPSICVNSGWEKVFYFKFTVQIGNHYFNCSWGKQQQTIKTRNYSLLKTILDKILVSHPLGILHLISNWHGKLAGKNSELYTSWEKDRRVCHCAVAYNSIETFLMRCIV